MSIIPAEKYPGKTAGKPAEYPLGKARNISSTGDGSGTPLEQAWVNDLFGFQQAILKAADIVASGAPDTAQNSQVLEAMRKLFMAKTETSELMEKLKVQVGEYIFLDVHMENAAAVAAYKGYGTWERGLEGRTAVGFSSKAGAHIDFTTFGKEYGEHSVTLTEAQMAEHKHSKGDLYNHFSAKASDIFARPDKAQYIGSGNGLTPGSQDNTNPSDEYQTGAMSAVAWEESVEQTVGGGEAHNNMPPAKTIDVWLRVG